LIRYCVHIEELQMRRKYALKRWEFLGFEAPYHGEKPCRLTNNSVITSEHTKEFIHLLHYEVKIGNKGQTR
jgi:hypothetical protein